ncbi:MAG: flagellar biosynthetic protein FliR [Firmicutes bacterium]|jgi:flagellar biosynthetic protein FliR|nr:flagellar biosynthetic protein FliR [Bacillota bacterium]
MASLEWTALLLLFVRFTAVFVPLPFLNRVRVPVLFKTGLAAMTAYLVFSANRTLVAELPAHFLSYFLMVAGEALVGLTIGLFTLFFFTVATVAGQYLDLQTGLTSASLFDPVYGTQVTLFAQFYQYFALVLYLTIDGHHYLLAALARSAELIPLGGAVLQPDLFPQFTAYFSQMVMLAFQLAMPVMAVLVFCDLALGLLAKTVPQLHVFMVGMPLKVGVALLIVYLIFPYVSQFLQTVFSSMHQNLSVLFSLF